MSVYQYSCLCVAEVPIPPFIPSSFASYRFDVPKRNGAARVMSTGIFIGAEVKLCPSASASSDGEKQQCRSILMCSRSFWRFEGEDTQHLYCLCCIVCVFVSVYVSACVRACVRACVPAGWGWGWWRVEHVRACWLCVHVCMSQHLFFDVTDLDELHCAFLLPCSIPFCSEQELSRYSNSSLRRERKVCSTYCRLLLLSALLTLLSFFWQLA